MVEEEEEEEEEERQMEEDEARDPKLHSSARKNRDLS